MVNGIKMALEEADYKVGDFTIVYDDLDDATAAAGQATAEGNGQCAEGGQRSERDGLHRPVQLRRGEDLDADSEQGRPADDQPGQHRRGADQAGQGRTGRAEAYRRPAR